jgi:two-component system chemotaxis response regulator CheB
MRIDTKSSQTNKGSSKKSPDFEIVVIGSSEGGLEALQNLFKYLPASSENVPVVIAQHRSSDSSGLMEMLQMRSSLPIIEPIDKQPIENGRIYLAPPDYHLLVERNYFCLSLDPAVHGCRPSIDVLFESAADTFRSKAAGFILTGSNRDGAKGLARIKHEGGLAVVQNPATAAKKRMPEAALAETEVDMIGSIEMIGTFLRDLMEGV